MHSAGVHANEKTAADSVHFTKVTENTKDSISSDLSYWTFCITVWYCSSVSVTSNFLTLYFKCQVSDNLKLPLVTLNISYPMCLVIIFGSAEHGSGFSYVAFNLAVNNYTHSKLRKVNSKTESSAVKVYLMNSDIPTKVSAFVLINRQNFLFAWLVWLAVLINSWPLSALFSFLIYTYIDP